MYKFDPMDFETCLALFSGGLDSMYKFDPMDFETSVIGQVQ